MIDIFFVNSVINIIWYIFSILFVLYKFTSFFSYIYNFGKFLGRLTQGVFYVKDRVVEFTEHRRNQYVTRPGTPSQSFFTRMKNKFTNYFWGKQSKPDIELPMYTRVSEIRFTPPKKNKKEDLHFEKCINELLSNEKNSFVSIDLSRSTNHLDSNYDSYFDPNCKTSDLDIERCENELCENESLLTQESESGNVKQKFNIQDSNMLFESNFIKKTFH